MNYLWATDIHLDHLTDDQVVQFAQSGRATGASGAFITGDISNAKSIVKHMAMLEAGLGMPIYFVLGNHDYYGGNTENVRKQMKELSNMSSYLKYMGDTNYISLTPSTAVVGHDGWYDAQHGDAQSSRVVMNDWYQIGDFWPHNCPGDIIARSRALAHAGTTHVMNGIKQAVRYASHIIVLTHFPPWPELSTYRGQPSDPDHMPWYTNKFMGDMLAQAASAFPDKRFTVLCGHSHGASVKQVAPNMVGRCGEAWYGKPAFQQFIEAY